VKSQDLCALTSLNAATARSMTGGLADNQRILGETSSLLLRNVVSATKRTLLRYNVIGK